MTEIDTNGHREVRTLQIRLSNGQPWSAPAEVVSRALRTLSLSNPELVGEHIMAALQGREPHQRKPRKSPSGAPNS